MRFMGEPAIGLAVSMKSGGDILILGEALQQEFARLQQELPAGMQLRKVSDQPAAVKTSVGEFVKVLIEALVIVLLVSFFSLGVRTGLVVALSIPLVLAMTFAAMNYLDIGLHKISLGALVLALGLMVDDAIIAVEMMAIKMEQGYDRLRAASFARTSTAFPMLTGTLITAAGFLPIATANSSTGEYTRSIFGRGDLADRLTDRCGDVRAADRGEAAAGHGQGAQAERRRRPRSVRHAVLSARAARGDVLRAPPQDRHPAHHGDLCRRRGAVPSGAATVLPRVRPSGADGGPQAGRRRLAEGDRSGGGAAGADAQERAGIDNYVAYVGTGSPRFYLPLDQQLPATSFAQFVVLADSIESREALRSWLIERMREDFPSLRGRVTRLENGPPVGYPVQFRVTGEHIDVVRGLARQVAAKVGENPHVANVHLDWQEPSKMVRLNVDQDRARALGVSTAELSGFLRRTFIGNSVSQFREDNELIEILLRGTERERLELSMLPSLAIPTESGRSVPLSQVATLEYGFEEGVIWHRNRLPTVTVRADVYGDEQPAALVRQIEPTRRTSVRSCLAAICWRSAARWRIRARPAFGERRPAAVRHRRDDPADGAAQELLALGHGLSHRAAGHHRCCTVPAAVRPAVRLRGDARYHRAVGNDHAQLGDPVDQVEQDIGAGQARFSAIVEATVRRFRPIVLTALASVLAMIPLSRSIFFGPMAVAIMGGLIVATALTLLFLPALYAAWFRVREGEVSAH